MRKLRGLIISGSAVLVLLFALSGISVFAASDDGWISKAAMYTTRTLHQTVVVDKKIYAIGGVSNGSAYLNTVEEYNPATNGWITKAAMSNAVIYHQVAVVDGKIYSVGGCNSKGSALNIMEEYDPATNVWTAKTAMTYERYNHRVAAVNGKIYAIGGQNSSTNYLNVVEEYDPATNKWSTKAPMPTVRANFEIAVADGKIYAIGGYNGAYLNTVEEYDTATNTWSTKAKMSTPRLYFKLAVLNNKIYAIGGSNGTVLNSVEAFDLGTYTWSSKASMNSTRFSHQTIIVNGKIYALGGINSSSITINSVEEYNPDSDKWSSIAAMKDCRSNFRTEVVNDKIYASGGNLDGKTICNTVEEYTPQITGPAETTLTAKKGNGKIELFWNAVPNAASYNIKKATASDGPYETIATSSAITYTDNAVSNGSSYYYAVTAVNANGEGKSSNIVAVIPENSDINLEVKSVDNALVGDEITANVVIHNAKTICAEDIRLTFDTDKLELVSAEGADGIKIFKEDNSAEGIRRYITASLGKANAANGDKVLLKLTFKAKAAGNARIDITNGRIADNATLEQDIEEKNCGEKLIFIKAFKDVNRNGEFTLLDLAIDAWYYGDAAADTDTSKYDADVVENGKIDDDDLAEIVNQILSNKNYSF